MCDPVRTLQDLGRMGQLACMALSPDLEASYLAVASCAPDLVLAVLDWRENVVLGRCSLAAPVSRLALSPLDDDVVSASGESFLKLWRLPAKKHDESGTAAPGEGAGGGQEEELRVLPDPAGLRDIPSTFTDHAWSLDPADGTLVTITEEGDIVIILAQASAPLRVLRRIDGCLWARPWGEALPQGEGEGGGSGPQHGHSNARPKVGRSGLGTSGSGVGKESGERSRSANCSVEI